VFNKAFFQLKTSTNHLLVVWGLYKFIPTEILKKVSSISKQFPQEIFTPDLLVKEYECWKGFSFLAHFLNKFYSLDISSTNMKEDENLLMSLFKQYEAHHKYGKQGLKLEFLYTPIDPSMKAIKEKCIEARQLASFFNFIIIFNFNLLLLIIIIIVI
jgi:hypothetical protein